LTKLAKCAHEFFSTLCEFFGTSPETGAAQPAPLAQPNHSASPAQNRPSQPAVDRSETSSEDESTEMQKSPPVHKVIRKVKKPSENHEESKANKEQGTPKKPRSAFILYNQQKMHEDKEKHGFSIFSKV